ncbi:overexpressed in colon carcinoma 1 protein isoform X4 [Lissotriton helveticus]
MGCGKSVATSQPGAGTTDAAKDITEESPTEDHQKRAGRRKVEVKSFAECPPNKHQLSSKTTISVRSYGGVYVGLPTDAATLAFSQRKVGQKSGK